jgi:hypothetical protein
MLDVGPAFIPFRSLFTMLSYHALYLTTQYLGIASAPKKPVNRCPLPSVDISTLQVGLQWERKERVVFYVTGSIASRLSLLLCLARS